MPDFIAPQLATLVKSPPTEDGWLHELKFDGYRMLCHLARGKVRFWSRNKKDWTSKFPGVAKAIKSLDTTNAIIDGEIVMLDARGRTSFQKLQQSMGKGGEGFVYEVFDLIYLDGFDLTRVPLKDRKRLLKALTESGGKTTVIRYSDHQEGNGALFFKQACEYGLEGIISKRADAPYESARSRTWLKVKCSKRQEFVIAGYTPSSKGLPGFGSLILGVYEKGDLVYAGRVGTGFSLKQRAEIGKKLDKIARPTPAFGVRPRAPGLSEARWTEPRLVAEVEFTEWTSDGSIRHPSFQGFREDKKPEEVRRELPQDSPATVVAAKKKPKSRR
jgi:bifunctional non-homologous end joining protein LigD